MLRHNKGKVPYELLPSVGPRKQASQLGLTKLKRGMINARAVAVAVAVARSFLRSFVVLALSLSCLEEPVLVCLTMYLFRAEFGQILNQGKGT